MASGGRSEQPASADGDPRGVSMETLYEVATTVADHDLREQLGGLIVKLKWEPVGPRHCRE